MSRIFPVGILPKCGYMLPRLDMWEILVQQSKCIGNLDNFVGWHLKFTQFYCCKPGRKEIVAKEPISSSSWRMSLFLAYLIHSLYSVLGAIYDTLKGPGVGEMEAITAGFRGLLLTDQAVVYFFIMQNLWRNEETVMVYNGILGMEKLLEKWEGSVDWRKLREKRLTRMALIMYCVGSTFFLFPPAYIWLLWRRPGTIKSVLEPLFTQSWYGSVFFFLEFVWATYAFGYSYTIVMETLMVGLFAASTGTSVLKEMRHRAHNCKSIEDWESVMRIHEGLRIVVNQLNITVNPLFLPLAVPALTSTLVFPYYGVIRIFSRQDLVEEFGLLFPIIVGIISFTASWFGAKALNACGTFPSVSKEVLREGRRHASLYRALCRTQEGQVYRRVFEKKIHAILSIAFRNVLDGPMTEIAGLYFIRNITVYTCNLLLMF